VRFLFIAFALAMANPSASQEAGQTPQIQAEQQSDAAAKSQSQRGEQGSRPVDVAPVGEQHASEDAKRKADSDARNALRRLANTGPSTFSARD